MQVLKSISFDVITYMSQLFDYYLFAVRIHSLDGSTVSQYVFIH